MKALGGYYLRFWASSSGNFSNSLTHSQLTYPLPPLSRTTGDSRLDSANASAQFSPAECKRRTEGRGDEMGWKKAEKSFNRLLFPSFSSYGIRYDILVVSVSQLSATLGNSRRIVSPITFLAAFHRLRLAFSTFWLNLLETLPGPVSKVERSCSFTVQNCREFLRFSKTFWN